MSKKGMKQAFDLLRMLSHKVKPAKQRVAKILSSFKKPIVCDMLARVVPDSLRCIQLRPVGRKLEDFHVAAVRLEPLLGFLLFVIRSIVLNQIDPVAAAIEGGHHHLLQKGQLGLPLKVVLLMQVGEAGVIQTDSTEDFLGMSFPPRRDLRLASSFGPSGMQGWCLPEGSLIFKNDHRAFAFGVFFRFG